MKKSTPTFSPSSTPLIQVWRYLTILGGDRSMRARDYSLSPGRPPLERMMAVTYFRRARSLLSCFPRDWNEPSSHRKNNDRNNCPCTLHFNRTVFVSIDKIYNAWRSRSSQLAPCNVQKYQICKRSCVIKFSKRQYYLGIIINHTQIVRNINRIYTSIWFIRRYKSRYKW